MVKDPQVETSIQKAEGLAVKFYIGPDHRGVPEGDRWAILSEALANWEKSTPKLAGGWLSEYCADYVRDVQERKKKFNHAQTPEEEKTVEIMMQTAESMMREFFYETKKSRLSDAEKWAILDPRLASMEKRALPEIGSARSGWLKKYCTAYLHAAEGRRQRVNAALDAAAITAQEPAPKTKPPRMKNLKFNLN
jgi:hypothetical protein